MTRRILGAIAAASLLAVPATAPATAQQSAPLDGNQLSNPGSAFVGDGRRATWHAEVEQTERGFRIGKPDAESSLIEFISYTCGHCATFAREGEGALDLTVLAPGRMNLEIRPVIRNAIDLTVSLLVQCGGADGFKDRHRMYLSRQDTWLTRARQAPQSQMASWSRGDKAARISMASALDLDDMLANKGTSRAEINTCLSDDEAALALIRNGNADREEFPIAGTPSFAMDGELLTDVHDWRTLSPAISARFRPGNGQE